MKKSRFTNEQIAFALKQAAVGTSGRGGLPEAWRLPADVLPWEEEFW